MSIELITELLGWCIIINVVFLMFASIWFMIFKSWTANLVANVYGLKEEHVRFAYFQYVAFYKIAIFVFNLVPYIALKIIA